MHVRHHTLCYIITFLEWGFPVSNMRRHIAALVETHGVKTSAFGQGPGRFPTCPPLRAAHEVDPDKLRHCSLNPTQKRTDLITSNELANARTAWGNGKIAISRAFEDEGIDAARKVASAHLDNVYGYNLGPVLFKPTMASGAQTFRPAKDGALAYFCGHSDEYPLDAGFAIRGWRSMTSETSAEYIDGNTAMWMGWVSLTDRDGDVTTVDKSFGYAKDDAGALRIVLHHSSLPFQP